MVTKSSNLQRCSTLFCGSAAGQCGKPPAYRQAS